jgi:hypothetical protein
MQRIKVNNPFALAPLTLLVAAHTDEWSVETLDFRAVMTRSCKQLFVRIVVSCYPLFRQSRWKRTTSPRVPTLALFAVTVINL